MANDNYRWPARREKRALETPNAWDGVRTRLVQADNVRRSRLNANAQSTIRHIDEFAPRNRTGATRRDPLKPVLQRASATVGVAAEWAAPSLLKELAEDQELRVGEAEEAVLEAPLAVRLGAAMPAEVLAQPVLQAVGLLLLPGRTPRLP